MSLKIIHAASRSQFLKYTLLAAWVSAGTLAAQTAPSQGSIAGQIFNAATGAPLKRATVSLTGPAGVAVAMPGRVGRGGPAQLSAETDAQGRFQFTGLPPGRYQMAAHRAGFLQQSYGARRSGAPGIAIVLSQDQQVTDAVVRLIPQGVITGRVLDEDGDPIPLAQITIFRQMYRNGKKQWMQVNGAAASEVGEFRASGLDPGRYVLAAQDHSPPVNTRFGAEQDLPQKPEMVYPTTYYPNGTNEQAAAPVEMGPGSEIRGIDIRMTRTPSFHVRGTVNGIPAAAGRGNANVGLVPKDGSFNQGMNTQALPPDEQFDLRGVAPGQYTIYARWGVGPNQVLASQPITVGAGHVTGVTLTMAPSFDLTGRVGIAESGAQVSLRNVHVTLLPVGSFFGNGPLTANSDADGNLSLKGLTPARYTVSVQGIPDGCFVQKVKYAGQEVTEDGADFSTPAPLEVVLSATAGKITGSVADQDGKPVPRGTVALIPSDAGLQSQSTTTDEQGNFTFSRLRPGTYRLLSWEDVDSDAWQDPEFRKPYDSRATEVKVGPSENQTAQLRVIPVEEMAAR